MDNEDLYDVGRISPRLHGTVEIMGGFLREIEFYRKLDREYKESREKRTSKLKDAPNETSED